MAENVPNAGSYIGKLGQDIANLRDAYNRVVGDNTYLTQMGGAAFLQAAPFNFSAGDATAWIAAFGNFANSSQMQTAIADSVITWGGN